MSGWNSLDLLDVLYTARNRLDYVRCTFDLLLANTDWPRVSKLYVYDDGSTDGTKRWLQSRVQLARKAGLNIELEHTNDGSPPALMNRYVAESAADWVAKIDSDVAVPPGWLEAMVGVLERNPEVELLGMEAGQTELAYRDGKEWDGTYGFEPSTHIGGVGLISVARFRQLPPIEAEGRFGWTQHQDVYRWVRGWITPDLPAPQLDRIPFEPWVTLRRRYFDEGWSRMWPLMDATFCRPYYDWVLSLSDPEVTLDAEAILSLDHVLDRLEWRPGDEEGLEVCELSLNPNAVHHLPEELFVVEWRDDHPNSDGVIPCLLGRRT